MNPTPLELLLSGRYQELLAQMRSPDLRGRLLAEVVSQLEGGADTLVCHPGADNATQTGVSAPPTLSERKLDLRANGDFSWGLLTPQQRRRFLLRDIRVVQRGPGRADAGRAQRLALGQLRGELQNLYRDLDLALREDDLDWLLPLAEHLVSLQEITGEFGTAREQYAALLDAAQRLGSSGGDAGAIELELHARLGLSVAHARLGDNRAALAEAEQAAWIASSLAGAEASVLHGAALHMAGTALAHLGDYSAARERLEQALALRRRRGDDHGTLATLNSLAYLTQYGGDATSARGLLGEALELCRRLGERRGEGLLLQNLGALEYEAGRIPQARDLYQQALAIFGELDDRRGQAGALSGLGFADYAAGALDKAADSQQRALSLCRETGDRYGEATALLALGALALLGGDHTAAQEYYGAAHELARVMEDSHTRGRALYGLGLCATAAGTHGEAASRIAEALALFAAADDSGALLDGLAYAAHTLAATGCSHEAASILDGTLALAERRGHQFDPLDRALLQGTRELLESAGARISQEVSLESSIQQAVAAAIAALAEIVA